MQGDLYHYNEGNDDYKLWFAPLGDSSVIRLQNLTNVDLIWEMSIDLGRVRTLSKVCKSLLHTLKYKIITTNCVPKGKIIPISTEFFFLM